VSRFRLALAVVALVLCIVAPSVLTVALHRRCRPLMTRRCTDPRTGTHGPCWAERCGVAAK